MEKLANWEVFKSASKRVNGNKKPYSNHRSALKAKAICVGGPERGLVLIERIGRGGWMGKMGNKKKSGGITLRGGERVLI